MPPRGFIPLFLPREARRVDARLAASFNRRVRAQTNFCGFANGIRKWNLNPLLATGAAVAFTIRNRVLRAVAPLLPRVKNTR